MNTQAKAENGVSAPQDYGVVTSPDTVRLERLLPGPIERVWSYLTESGKRAEWLAAGEMELEIGGCVEHVFNNSRLTGEYDPPPARYEKYGSESAMHGRVTACNPPYLLAYTWGGEPSEDNSEVRFELSRQGDDVRLVLTHTRLATREGMLSVTSGWHAHVDILAARLENRRPEKFWPLHSRLEAEYERRIPAANS